MRIVDLLNRESILLGASPKSKSEAIDMLVDLQVKGGNIADREEYKKGILAREAMSSTAWTTKRWTTSPPTCCS